MNIKRISFSYAHAAGNERGASRQPLFNRTAPEIACNRITKAPELTASARAGSKISFMWNPWYISHKGPLLTYMASYEGDIKHVNVNELTFFKIRESGLASDNKTWATEEMIANGNITSALIPHGLKPGTYIIRHELISLHYGTKDSLYNNPERGPPEGRIIGPQVSIMTPLLTSICIDVPSSTSSNAST
jgi:cellulase